MLRRRVFYSHNVPWFSSENKFNKGFPLYVTMAFLTAAVFVHRRVSRWLGTYFGIGVPLEVVLGALADLASFRAAFFTSCVIKTWVSAWCTADRFKQVPGQEPFMCSYCIQDLDSMYHTIVCKCFVTLVCDALNAALHRRGCVLQVSPFHGEIQE